MAAIEDMSVSADLADEDLEDSNALGTLGKRKRDQTTRYTPSDDFAAAGPSRKISKRRISVDEEILDDSSPSKSIQPPSVRELLQRVFLDLTGDEADSVDNDLVDIVNELGSLASLNKEQKNAWLLHVKSFVKPV